MKKSMKRILKKIVKVILYTLLILVLAVISIFAWDKVGQKWRELNFKPKPELSVIGKPFIYFEDELPDSTVHRLSEYAGKRIRPISMSCSTSGHRGAVPASALSPC